LSKLLDLISGYGRAMAIPLLGYPGVYLNNTTIKDNVHNADVHVSTLQAIQENFAPDGLFCFMDLSVEAGALGLEVLFPEMDSPTVVGHPVRTRADLERFEGIDILGDARLQSFVETMRRLAAMDGPLIGGYVIGPFSLTGLLMGASEAALATMTDPATVEAALRLATNCIARYVQALEQAGADMVAILEPSGGLLSPHHFEHFCGRYVRELIAGMRSASILHICGQTTRHLEAMAATGAQGLSLDAAVDFPAAAQRISQAVALIGNLDTVTVMNQMNAREVYGAASDLIAAMAPFPNFILSSACDLPLDTPHENIDAMLQAARDAK
jgi:uroporphyrinogen decarboxylase